MKNPSFFTMSSFSRICSWGIFVCLASILAVFCSETVLAQADWNTSLSAAEGGFWKKRIPISIEISDEQLAKLKRLNEEKLQSGDSKAKDSNDEADTDTGMRTKLEPQNFSFTIVTPEEKARASAEEQAFLIPLAGTMAQEIRVCDASQIEYLFEILDSQNDPQHKGILKSGSQLVIPIELTTIPQKSVFYVYFANPKAWQIPDWWQMRLFSNGSFEQGSKTAANWNLDKSYGEYKITRSDDCAKEGRYSMKTVVSPGAEPSWIGARQTVYSVRPGQRWRLSGWTKAENVEGFAGWFYHLGNAAKGMIGNGMLHAGKGTFDWKQTSEEFTIPAGADRILVGTVLRGTGTAWADDLRLELIEDSRFDAEVSCKVGEIETFPLAELYPTRGQGGSTAFDAVRFFGTDKLPRFSFICVKNGTNEERNPLVNVNSVLISTRWGIDLTPESIEIFDLNGKSLPFHAWGTNLFVKPTLPAQSVSYLLLCEKPTAVSRKEAARQKRAEIQEDSGFPGTSLQQVKTYSKVLTLESAEALDIVLKENLVKNAGFEQLNESGLPKEWSFGPNGDGISFNVVSPQADEEILGKNCAQVLFEPNCKTNWNGWRQSVPVKGGRTYFCGVWMKSLAEEEILSVHVHFHDAEHRLVANGMTSFSSKAAPKGEWGLISGMVPVPVDAVWISLQLTTNKPSSFCLDNVFVTEMESGTPERFQGGETGIFQVSPIIKVFPDSTWTRNPKDLAEYRFRAVKTAKNEEETIQFAFRFAENRCFQTSLTPAVSKDGKTVLPTELFAVGYVPVKHVTSYYSTRKAKWFRKLPGGLGRADGWVGYWPDPLIRFPNAKNAVGDVTSGPSTSEQEKTRALWRKLREAEYSSDSERLRCMGEQNLLEFKAWETRALCLTVKTGKEIPAGIYEGKISLRDLETGKVETVPFSVDVKDFAIPDEPACTAIYDCRASHIDYWNETDASQLVKNMVKFLASKRLASDRLNVEPKYTYNSETGEWTADFTEFDAACEEYFNELKVPLTYMPGDWYCFGWGMPPRPRQGIQPYDGEWPFEGVDRGKLNPAFKKVYQDKLRLFWNHVKEKGWSRHFVLYISDEPFYHLQHIIEQMKACCEMIHEVDPNIPIYASTWGHVPEWDGHITVWGIGHYGRVPEEQIRKSLARGDRIWWTTDGQMCTDTPYCATERLLPYWCMKYGADAYEFWGASWYTYDPYQYGWHSYIYQSDQPGVEYYVLYPNGDGYIFYPDKLLGVNEMVSSIRLEQAREGVEDAAYLVRLKAEIARVETLKNLSPQAAQTLKNARNTLARAFDLVHIPNAGGRFTSHYLPNPEEVDEVKALILDLLEELQGIGR